MIKSQSGAAVGNSSPHVSVIIIIEEECQNDKTKQKKKNGVGSLRKLTLDMGERRGDVVCSTVMSNVVLNLLVIVV